MYQISEEDRQMVLCESDMTNDVDAHQSILEESIARTVPAIRGMDENLTEAERMELYKVTMQSQYSTFVAQHGAPFGAEGVIDTIAAEVIPLTTPAQGTISISQEETVGNAVIQRAIAA
jgi:hypothetical protein